MSSLWVVWSKEESMAYLFFSIWHTITPTKYNYHPFLISQPNENLDEISFSPITSTLLKNRTLSSHFLFLSTSILISSGVISYLIPPLNTEGVANVIVSNNSHNEVNGLLTFYLSLTLKSTAPFWFQFQFRSNNSAP